MSRWKTWQSRIGGLAVFTLVRRWMSTLDYQGMLYDPTADPANESFRPPVIFILWHEYIPCPFYLRPRCDTAMLLSQHRDANWLTEAAHLMGYSTVRGSTKRGGDAAIRKLVRASRSLSLAITPDGPRGPRRRVAPGCVFLSSLLNIPLVPFAVGYDRPWRMPTWDRFAVPRPYSRARLIVGPRVQIPPDLDRQRLELYRGQVESLLLRLSTEVEEWAESGERRRGQVPYRRQPLRFTPEEEPRLHAFPSTGTMLRARSA